MEPAESASDVDSDPTSKARWQNSRQVTKWCCRFHVDSVSLSGRSVEGTGCTPGRLCQRVLDPEIHQAALRVLARNGVEVIVPKGQGCCGALAWHLGYAEVAQQFAKRNLLAFPRDVDAILSSAAGCGSAMHEYPVLMSGTKHIQDAEAFARLSKDILSYLDQLGIEKP